MADNASLMTALRNAHNAGDSAGATRIAAMINSGQSQGQEQALPWYTPITSAIPNAYSAGAGLVNSALHPIDTLTGITDFGTGAVTRGLNRILPSSMEIKPQNPNEQRMLDMADAAGSSIQNSLSSPTQAWNTIATHPIDTLLMLAPGLGMASKGAAAAGLSRTSSLLGKASEFSNPVNMVGKPIQSLRDSAFMQPSNLKLAAQDLKVPQSSLLEVRNSIGNLNDARNQNSLLGPYVMAAHLSPQATQDARTLSAIEHLKQ